MKIIDRKNGDRVEYYYYPNGMLMAKEIISKNGEIKREWKYDEDGNLIK